MASESPVFDIPAAGNPDPFTAYDPFQNPGRMQRQMDSLIDNLWGPGLSGNTGMFGFSAATPEITLNETRDDYRIEVEVLPDTEINLQTEVEDGTVVVFGTVSQNSRSNSGSLTSSFVSQSQFSRSFPLAKPVDPLGMQMEQHDDRIVISIPKG